MSGRDRGAALLAAIGALALFTALAAAALPLATQPAARAASAAARAEAEALAEAAIHRLAAALTDPAEARALPRDGGVVETTLLDGRLTLSAQDVAGLVDLNAAPGPVLRRLLRVSGAEPAVARRAADALVVARAGARRAFAAPAAALQALQGAERAALADALPYATVWSGAPTVDLWSAPAPALAAAGDAPLAQAQAYVARRAAMGRRVPPPKMDRAHLASGGLGRRLRLTATAEGPMGGRARVTAVVEAAPGPPARWRFLAWR